MILQALYEYALRNAENLVEDGFENKEIKYLIKIRPDGSFINLESTIEDKKGKTFVLPQSIGRSGKNAWQSPFLLWDHYGFVLAEPKKEDREEKQAGAFEMAQKQNEEFVKKIASLPEDVRRDRGVSAVLKFYGENKENGLDKVRSSSLWADCQKISGCNLTFKLEGDDCLVAQREVVKEYVRNELQSQLVANVTDSEEPGDDDDGICLITGDRAKIARLHAFIHIRNSEGKETNAKLVSFQNDSGYDSYEKKQSFNAPVSRQAELLYTKALNHLIKSDRNRYYLGVDTIVFWAEKAGWQDQECFIEDKLEDTLEDNLALFFNPGPSDDPDRGVLAVKALLDSVKSGRWNQVNSNFHVLCLSPAAARISVRFWETGPVKTFAERIAQHFMDFEIAKGPKDVEFLSLYQILRSIALKGELSQLAPNLIGAVSEAIFKGLPYPETLQQQCISRIRAERKVTRERAAILKAYLNRHYRKNNEKEVSVALDRTNVGTGYLLGRLFAVLEEVQKEVNRINERKLTTTITDKFYGAASTNPSTVFPQLLKLNQHHMSSYGDKQGLKVNREKEIGEIMDKLQTFPSHLMLSEQSEFAIGYYHEKQSFFAANNKNDKDKGVGDEQN